MKKTRRTTLATTTALAAAPTTIPRKHARRRPRAQPAPVPSVSPSPTTPAPSAAPSPATPAQPIPPGYRELHQGEKILRSDHILVDGAWTRRDSPAGRTKSWALGESYNCYPDGHPAYHGFHHLTLRRLPRSTQPAASPSPTADRPLSPSLPRSVSPSSAAATPACDPGPGYRLLSDDEPLLAGDQINDTDGTWQKPLRRDDPPTLRQRRKNLNTPESRRAWPGRATQIQVRRKLPAAVPTPAPMPASAPEPASTPGHTLAPSAAFPPPPSTASLSPSAPSSPAPAVAHSTAFSVSLDIAASAASAPDHSVSPSLPLSVSPSSAAAPRWRQLAPGEFLQPGDEVTARPTDDLQAPAGAQLWIAHRPDDPSLDQPVPARTPCRYRRQLPAAPASAVPSSTAFSVEFPAGVAATPPAPHPIASPHPSLPPSLPLSACPIPTAPLSAAPEGPLAHADSRPPSASSRLFVAIPPSPLPSPSTSAPLSPPPSSSPSATAPKPGPGHRLLADDDILRPGDQRTRQKSYAGAWEPVGATLHGLTTRAARRVYSTHNAEGQPDPLHFRRPYLAPDQRTPLALPPGTRELHPGEPILPTDHYLWGREWLPRATTRNLGRPYHPGQNRLTIRALDLPAPSTPQPAPAQVNPSTPPTPSATHTQPTPTCNQVSNSAPSLTATLVAAASARLRTPTPELPTALHAHTDAATASTQSADTPTPLPAPALFPSLPLSVPPSSAPCGDGYRPLAPHEVIQSGDEWKCDGTGCPTYRTLNPHHGRTVAEVNAHRSPDLPRHYRRKLPAPPAIIPTRSPHTGLAPDAPSPAPLPASPPTPPAEASPQTLNLSNGAKADPAAHPLSPNSELQTPNSDFAAHGEIPDHPGQLYLTPDLAPTSSEKLIAIAYHTTLSEHRSLRVTKYTDGTRSVEITAGPTPLHFTLPPDLAQALHRALTIAD